MSLLRSDSGDGSINFQKASCTLDGCVKVWTSRVDSVVTETGKLLNGLVGDGRGAVDDGDDASGELELDEDGNPIGPRGKKDKKKRARAKEATLVKNFSAIAVKKLDLEYTVDPLFKKTSADFDEGGAGGLLMNHLGVDDGMRVVFDAGEAPGLPTDDDSKEVDDEEDEDAEDADKATQAIDQVDLTRLIGKLFGDDSATVLKDSFDPLAELLQGRMVCPSLSRFSFAPDQEHALFGQEADVSDDDEDDHAGGIYLNPTVTATPWGGDDGAAQDFAFGSPGGFDGEGGEDSGADLFGVPAELDRDAEVFGLPAEGPSSFNHQSSQYPQQQSQGAGDDDFDFLDGGEGPLGLQGEDGEENVHWDPRQGPSQHDLLLAFKGVSGNNDEGQDGESGGAQAAGGLFDYFDQKLMKSWAGPEHWKMRSRLAGFGGFQSAQHQAGNGEAGEGDDLASAKKKRAPKEAFVIDFTSEEGAVSAKELFEAPRSSATTVLPKTRSKPEAFLLPEDRHFSSRMLLRLFSKPRAVLNIRTRKGAVRFGGPNLPGFAGGSGEGEVDGEFWAQQQAAREAEGFDFIGGDGDGGEGAMPLDTQFYHDGDDEGAFELASSMPQQSNPNSAIDVDVADFEEADLAAQAAAMKRVKPEYVNYAKKAKRVDVRKLKENIWKELGIEGVVATEEGRVDESEDEDLVSTQALFAQTGQLADARQSFTAQDTPRTPRSSPPPSAMSALQPKTFRSVLTGLRKAYPKEKMEEISTSFCFICLLHLANEEGLEIKIGEQGNSNSFSARKLNGAFKTPGRIIEEDEEDEDEDGEGGDGAEGEDDDEDWTSLPVGRLEYLRIKKDPKAGRSA